MTAPLALCLSAGFNTNLHGHSGHQAQVRLRDCVSGCGVCKVLASGLVAVHLDLAHALGCSQHDSTCALVLPRASFLSGH